MKAAQLKPKYKTTRDAWQASFGDSAAVGLSHPELEIFFEEINKQCIAEDNEQEDAAPSYSESWEQYQRFKEEDARRNAWTMGS